ncbi:GLEYA domain-containing protein [Colletotrichum lupini]|nr:GLEYA domain-containing protein [Colletotrichum lupini]
MTSTGTQTGLTTIIPTNPAGTTSVITFVIPSSSSTSTSTSSSSCTIPTASCTPELLWTYYGLAQAPTETASSSGNIPFHGNGADGQANWKMTYFNINTVLSGQNPDNTGRTTTIGLAQQCITTTRTVYGTTTSGQSQFMIVQHIGYFHPVTSGTYTFSFSNVDDGVYLWLGNNAKTGFTNANVNKNVDYYVTNSAGTYTFTATAGQYYPIRLLFFNAQQCGSFTFSLTDQAGGVVVSNSQAVGDRLVASCPNDSNAAPFGF